MHFLNHYFYALWICYNCGWDGLAPTKVSKLRGMDHVAPSPFSFKNKNASGLYSPFLWKGCFFVYLLSEDYSKGIQKSNKLIKATFVKAVWLDHSKKSNREIKMHRTVLPARLFVLFCCSVGFSQQATRYCQHSYCRYIEGSTNSKIIISAPHGGSKCKVVYFYYFYYQVWFQKVKTWQVPSKDVCKGGWTNVTVTRICFVAHLFILTAAHTLSVPQESTRQV